MQFQQPVVKYYMFYFQDVKKVFHNIISKCEGIADTAVIKYTGRTLNLRLKAIASEDGKSTVACSDKTLKKKLGI